MGHQLVPEIKMSFQNENLYKIETFKSKCCASDLDNIRNFDTLDIIRTYLNILDISRTNGHFCCGAPRS